MSVSDVDQGSHPPTAPVPAKQRSPTDLHVLLVDDEVLSRTVIGSLLKKCNYRGKWNSLLKTFESSKNQPGRRGQAEGGFVSSDCG